MSTIENNKLIAEFMGISHQKMAMNFNSNWNLMMDAVEKIESLGFTFEIKKNWTRITHKRKDVVLRWEEDSSKIEATYNACIEFIKLYK